MAQFEAGDRFALGPVLALLMGLRASEITGLTVRDVDDGAAVLWVHGSKTANAKRHLKVPVKLRPLLVRATADRKSTEPLFAGKSRQDLHRRVWKLCDESGVPRVCPHSLRGLWATLAVESGQACEAVAAALGHGNFVITAKHYVQPSAVHGASSDRVGAALFRDPSEELN